MPYIISPLSDIIRDLMMAQLETQHVAVNKRIESVLCVTVLTQPCDLLTQTGMSP
jgi:hypothetical protein